MSILSIVKKLCCCCFKSDKETELHSCLSINPSGHQFSYQSLSNDSESSGEVFAILSQRIPPSTPSERHRSRQRSSSSIGASSQCRVYQRSKKGYTVIEDGDCPKLECIIIPSFGKCPPDNIAVKKASNDFLEGVGDDLEIIQSLIVDDVDKELSRVELMCHFKQVKKKVFETKIRSRMENIKLTRDPTSTCQKGRKCGMYLD